MGLTVAATTRGKMPSAPVFITKLSCVPDTSYPTGGEALDIVADHLPGHTILGVWFGRAYTTSGGAPAGVSASWDATAKKLVLLDASNVEEGNGDNQSAITYEMIVASY